MSWNIPLYSSAFPPAIQAGLSPTFAVDECDLSWSAMTVGRPNRAAVLSHGHFSVAEMLWRRSIVDANVQAIPSLTGLHNSPAFDALDMTEKGWINFSLGMLFTKLCADKLLNMPWLLHFKWFQTQYPVTMAPGGSTPDFIGVNPLTGQHHVLEAKGRNSGFSTAILQQAKAQALQPIAVNGQACGMHIGALLYRLAGNRLAMAMIDPKPEEGARWEATDVQATWAEYYRVAWGLANLGPEQSARLEAALGLTVGFDERAYPHVKRLMQAEAGDGWKEARDRLLDWSVRYSRSDDVGVLDAVSGRKTYGDGIRLKYSGRPISALPDSE